MNSITGVLLAAGSGRRFGGNKLLHPLPDGEPLGVAAARHLVAAVPEVLAVVRAGDRDLATALEDLGLIVVENLGADSGMGSSIAVAVGASPRAGGWLIALGDMPWIQPATIVGLADALTNGASMVAPVCAGRRGHPVGFSSKWGASLGKLHGDTGARTLIATHASELLLKPVSDDGVLRDVDYPSAL